MCGVRLTFAPKRRRFLRWRTLVVAVVVAGIAAGVAVVLRDNGPPALPSGLVDGFLADWSRGATAPAATMFDTPPRDLAARMTSLVHSAPNSTAKYTRTSLVRTRDGAAATYHAAVDIAGFGSFAWDGAMSATRVKVGTQDQWRLHWQPDVLYPGLAEGQQLEFHLKWPARASIIAADGTLLAGTQSIVTIGLEPDRVGSGLDHIKQLLQTLAGTDPATIDAALHTPGIQPNYFVPVASVSDDDRYRSTIRPQLAPIPGVFFHRGSGVLNASTTLGTQVIGSVGDITAERLKRLGAPYTRGDKVGLGGLQAAFETRLAGKPSGSIEIVARNKVVRTVQSFAGAPGQPVKLTIDPRTQQAAEAALAGVAQPAALVAIDTATGGLRAIVSKPDGGFNRALDGAYPPGSTFKVVTTTALLRAGRAPNTPAPCPPTITVNGRVFRNFEGEAAGAIDLAEAFKISCNNAFIGLADQLPPDALGKSAASYGFNVAWDLPTPVARGSYPTPRDGAELAASAIGQGRVLASPAQMASVAAAVAAGQWHSPVLTTQPKAASKSAPAIEPNVLEALRSMMASVAQPGGTAAGSGLPAGVFGKTGTAEFGPKNPPDTHAWFIGYRGGLAFAIVVEGGGVGGRVAAPLAAAFLNALPSS